MKILKKSDAEIVKRDDLESCEYVAGDPDINLAIVTVKGRHPAQNLTMNTKCKELLYVLSGKGFLTVNGKKYQFDVGDEIIIDAGVPYYFEGNFTVATVCTPAWTLEQVKEVL